MKIEDIPEKYRLSRDENGNIKTKEDISAMYNLDCTIGLFLEIISGKDLDTSLERLVKCLEKLDDDLIKLPEEAIIEYKKKIYKSLNNLQSAIMDISTLRINISKEIIEKYAPKE